MRTVAVTYIVTDRGDVKQITWVDETSSAFNQELSLYAVPYLGSYDNEDDWLRALGAYATGVLLAYGYAGCHGDRLVYRSKGRRVLVFEVDFDYAAL